MLKIKRNKKSVSKNLYKLEKGDVVDIRGQEFSFERVKRGNKSWVGQNVKTEQMYSIKIRDFLTETVEVVGKQIVSKTSNSSNSSIKIKDVKLNEFVIIMSNSKKAEMYQLVEIKSANKYSHTFENPVTKVRMKYPADAGWEVYRVNDLTK